MLHLNQDTSVTTNGHTETGKDSGAYPENEPIWKVLVFDRSCRDIISTVLKVNDLRENGITVHMLLESERSPIPDVPAIYFMEPTKQNIDYFIRVKLHFFIARIIAFRSIMGYLSYTLTFLYIGCYPRSVRFILY